MDNTLAGRIIRFERFRLDTAKQILWCDNAIIELTPKSAAVLCELVIHAGEIVTKSELIERVWPDSFVEESNLSHQVYSLRRVFRDNGAAETLIETIPRKGYRFTGTVFTDADESAVRGDSTAVRTSQGEFVVLEPITAPPEQVAVPRSRSKWPFAVAALLVLVIVSGFAAWKFGTRDGQPIRSLAVLPIRSFNDSNENRELQLRMTDSLITRLGRLKDIAVRPTSAVMRFATANDDPLDVGRKLAVDAVIDGRIQTESGKIRVTLQLLSVANGDRIWSEQFDGDENRLLDLQDKISAQLLAHLNLSLSTEQRSTFAKRPTLNPDAFEEYLKGRAAWQKRTEVGLREAITFYENATRLDPGFAEALVGLADSHFLLVDYNYDISPANVVKAQDYLSRAIELDPALPDAYTTLGYIQTGYLWTWDEAERNLAKAIELAPNSATSHHRFGMLMVRLRRFNEAEASLRRARELDPTSPSINMNLGVVLYFSKRYAGALEQFDATIASDPNFVSPRWYRARCLWMMNKRDESVAEYARAIRFTGNEKTAAQLDKLAAEPLAAINYLFNEWKAATGPEAVDDHSIAILAALVGDAETALKYLERSVESRHPWSTTINAEPEFDFIQTNPQFEEVLKKLKLRPRMGS